MKRLFILTVITILAAFPLAAQQDSLLVTPSDTVVTELFAPASTNNGVGVLDVHQSDAVRSGFLSRFSKPAGNITGKGFRVVVYKGNSQQARTESQNVFATFKSNYGYSAYLRYSNPDFIVVVGDCRTRSQAEKILNSVKGAYPTAYVIEDKINLRTIHTDEQ